MKPTRIFLDMDDVLNCFTISALEHVGCPADSEYDPEWEFDIVLAANALHPWRTFTKSVFWRLLDQEFWASLPISDELPMLLDMCEELVGREGICILTNPIQEWLPYVAAAKMEWIHRFLPSWLHRQFLIGPCKRFCAQPDALLIDDSEENVEKFCVYGGRAILVPRPWNAFHHLCPKSHLRDAFRWLQQS